MQLEDIRANQLLDGVAPNHIATAVAVVALSPGTVQLIYRLDDCTLGERLLTRDDEPTIHLATNARPWSFDGDPDAFQLAVGAKRIDLAFLFDPHLPADTCGWDLTSFPPPVDGRHPEPRHIEVKGRLRGGTTITVTRNKIHYGCNQLDKFVLAIVRVAEEGDDTVDGPFYVLRPFTAEPDRGVSPSSSSPSS